MIERQFTDGEMAGTALFSDDMQYRFVLTRSWGSSGLAINFIMLNPSTATEEVFDNTVRRCYNYARQWGAHKLVVTNLFAYRSTAPENLYTVDDPVGEDNTQIIMREAESAWMVICGWGNHGGHLGRGASMLDALYALKRGALYHMGLTKTGHPRHPLYLPKNRVPIRFDRSLP